MNQRLVYHFPSHKHCTPPIYHQNEAMFSIQLKLKMLKKCDSTHVSNFSHYIIHYYSKQSNDDEYEMTIMHQIMYELILKYFQTGYTYEDFY